MEKIRDCYFRFKIWIKKNPRVVEGNKGNKSICLKSVHKKNSDLKFRDILMEISMLSEKNSISNFVNNIDDIAILFSHLTPAVNEFFTNSFIETHQT